jgi:hypothetical protein
VWKTRARARKFLSASSFALLLGPVALGQVAAAQSLPTDAHTGDVFDVALERDEQASGCPDLAWFRERIAAHAGESRQAGTFKVVLARRGDTWLAKIQRWDAKRSAPAAERVLSDRGTECQPLAEAAAVTVAILADDFAQHPEPQPVSMRASNPIQRVSADAAPSRSADASKVWLGVGGGATSSFIAPVAPLLGFALGIDALYWRHGLRVMLTTEREFELPPGSVVVQAWLATMLSCWRFNRDHFGAALCANVDAAMLRASAQGYADGRSSTRPYGAAGLELQPSWFISNRYRISAAAGVVAPFTRESFSVTGLGVAYVPAFVSWRVLLLSELGAF